MDVSTDFDYRTYFDDIRGQIVRMLIGGGLPLPTSALVDALAQIVSWGDHWPTEASDDLVLTPDEARALVTHLREHAILPDAE